MPGILGTYNRNHPTGVEAFEKALNHLIYLPKQKTVKRYIDDSFLAGLIPFSGQKLKSDHGPDIKVWFDGEVYPIEKNAFIEDQFINAYNQNKLSPFLKKLNGYFSAAVYDKENKRVLLITDRYGIKPLYLYQDSNKIAWSSEIKAILQLDNIEINYDTQAMKEYLSFGMIAGDKTWYKNINLIPASSITTIDLNTLSISSKKYWTWNDLSYNQEIDFNDAVDHTSHLLYKAISERILANEKTTLALSGGLDSRVLLSMSKQPENINSFTFGCLNAPDFTIAKEAARRSGSTHIGYISDEHNWLEGKLKSVWRTEGFMPFTHLHSSPFCEQFPKLGDSVLNGFGGATLLGGLFLKSQLEKKVLSSRNTLSVPRTDFYSPFCPEAKVINQHMRRFINQGSIDMGKYLYQRKPFMDTHLLDFVLTLPMKYRRRYKLFSAVINNNIPDALKALPWENTGIPISSKIQTNIALRLKWPAIKRRLALDPPIFDYKKWIATPSGSKLKAKYCHSSQTHIAQILKEDGIYKHYNPKEDHQLFGRYLSLELWLHITNNEISIDESLTSF